MSAQERKKGTPPLETETKESKAQATNPTRQNHLSQKNNKKLSKEERGGRAVPFVALAFAEKKEGGRGQSGK